MPRRVPRPPIPSPSPTHSLISKIEGPFNPQSSSPLFSTIPPEIRNKIFSFALYSYDNKSRPYPDGTYFSRPGYRYHQGISTALLEACKRIYTETHDLPISQNEHVFWCSSSRGPPGRSFCDKPSGYFERFTVEQRAAVVQVHLFTQLFWLEGSAFDNFCNIQDIHLRYLKITVRHADWWHWESNKPLLLRHEWMDKLKLLLKLGTLDVELETMERDKDQMEAIVKNLFQRQIPVAYSRTLTTHGNPIFRERYMGTSTYDNRIYYSSQSNRWTAGRPSHAPEDLPYVVSTIRWTAEALN
ncbi:hypothetical protein CVT25_005610 [Psilocybe cyanescens]|uniref:Uncharacterized protein n=1 Tax=Psilocybe cyanescens TaxID=93625 RepID=A0A409VV18_PSICY|nr:hypothetical protein CVT25_005610 [Psilocybe cyanescens]